MKKLLFAPIVLALFSNCLVVTLWEPYDHGDLVMNDRLVGTWVDGDDRYTVTANPADTSYTVRCTHNTDTLYRLVARLFQLQDRLFIDLTVDGVPAYKYGAMTMVTHSVYAVAWIGDSLCIRMMIPPSVEALTSRFESVNLPFGVLITDTTTVLGEMLEWDDLSEVFTGEEWAFVREE